MINTRTEEGKAMEGKRQTQEKGECDGHESKMEGQKNY